MCEFVSRLVPECVGVITLCVDERLGGGAFDPRIRVAAAEVLDGFKMLVRPLLTTKPNELSQPEGGS
jgi:hypothetical protein